MQFNPHSNAFAHCINQNWKQFACGKCRPCKIGYGIAIRISVNSLQLSKDDKLDCRSIGADFLKYRRPQCKFVFSVLPLQFIGRYESKIVIEHHVFVGIAQMPERSRSLSSCYLGLKRPYEHENDVRQLMNSSTKFRETWAKERERVWERGGGLPNTHTYSFGIIVHVLSYIVCTNISDF